jgi:hypothetical protein
MHVKDTLWVLLAMVLVACGGEDGDEEAGPTWYGDVAHVARDRCMSCHNDEAPTFSMARYDETLRERAPLMAAFTADGTMPPWKPESDCNSFRDERVLTDEEKALFASWAAAGAPEGDPAAGPPPLDAAVGLARVDASMTMGADYTPAPAAGEMDDMRCFVLDPALHDDRLLVGFDIHPGERRVVHHVLLFLTDAAGAAGLDDGADGYSCFGGTGAPNAQVIAGWIPGMPAANFPATTGIPLAAGSRIVMQIHYNVAQAGPLPDRSSVELMYSDGPMPRQAQLLSFRQAKFEIPPHSEGYSASIDVAVPSDGTVWAVTPHMHRLGRRAHIELERDGGQDECLIDIRDWDFDWQQFYFFDRPEGFAVSRGDRIKMTCTWDNDGDGPVRWGEGTGDEMCVFYAYVTGP